MEAGTFLNYLPVDSPSGGEEYHFDFPSCSLGLGSQESWNIDIAPIQ